MMTTRTSNTQRSFGKRKLSFCSRHRRSSRGRLIAATASPGAAELIRTRSVPRESEPALKPLAPEPLPLPRAAPTPPFGRAPLQDTPHPRIVARECFASASPLLAEGLVWGALAEARDLRSCTDGRGGPSPPAAPRRRDGPAISFFTNYFFREGRKEHPITQTKGAAVSSRHPWFARLGNPP